MSAEVKRKPLLLMILDGWGYRSDRESNAIALAHTPCWDEMWQNDPHTLIETSGEAVGLPDGQMGNSEVGHMNIGAGRIVYQDFTRVTQAIRDGSFHDNTALCSAIEAARKNGGTVHIMGLLSPGGVHSHDDHFIETVRLAAERGASAIAVHGFLDGRDTPPRSAEASIARMQQELDSIPGGRFNTISGRYYAMDRDKRWDRVEKAYRAIASAESGNREETALQALHAAYQRGELDELGRACFMAERDRKELFAASIDGLDYRNLAADPGHRDEMERLKGALDAWRESTGDFDYRPYEAPK